MSMPETSDTQLDVAGQSPNAAAVGGQLTKILTAEEFDKSPRLRRFLRFVIAEAMNGNADSLKERVIAYEVFERDESFDPTTNSVVRVEASRLRNRLKQYYLGPGRDDPISIMLPAGTYAPTIDWRQDDGSSQNATPERPRDKVLSLPDKPSIAILPFVNLSDDPQQEFFADGLTSDLITALSRIRWLFVIARNSSFVYKGSAPDIRRVGRELGVRYVVEGDIRRSGNKVRISAQLIDASNGSHVWAKRYDHELAELFDLTDEITEEIAGAIEPAIGEAEREHAGRKAPDNLDAWESYQRGLWHLRQFSNRDNDAAKDFFARAISLDGRFAPPHGALAYTRILDIILGFTRSRAQSIATAIAAGREGIAIDDKDPMSHFGLGRAFSFAGEHEAALSELEIAVDLNPNFALAYLGIGVVLNFSGRPDEAIEPLDTAIRLSPNDPIAWTMENARSASAIDLGQYESALEYARLACRHPNTGWISFLCLASALGLLGRLEEAHSALAEVFRIKSDYTWQFTIAGNAPCATKRNNNFGDGLRKAGLDVPNEGWFSNS